jgi:hypothetical protein
MAYKFQLGKAKLSGSIETAQGITSQGGLLVNGDVDLDAGVINNAELENSEITVNGYATALGSSVTLDTDDVGEGSSNLYWTEARFDASLATKDTDDLAEGSNLYYTDARVHAAVSAGAGVTYDNAGEFSISAGAITNDMLSGSIASSKLAELDAFDTDALDEGATNLYYTDARVHAAVSAGDGLTYDAAGQFAVTSSIAGAGLAWEAGVLSVDTDEIIGSLSGTVEGIVDGHLVGGTGITYSAGDISIDFSEFDSGDVVEGSNLFFTDARARAAVSATDAGGDGSFSYDSATGEFTYTGPSASEVRAHFTASKGVVYDSASGNFGITGSIAGQALSWDGASGILNVAVTGAVQIAADKLGVHSSVAGAGLGHASDVNGMISSLSVNVDNASIEINSDIVRVKALGIQNSMLSGGIENAKLVNSSVTVVAGEALTGGGTVALGSSITLDVAVNGDALEISGDAVALKSTIAGSRTFSGDVTISGGLTVTGTTTYINTTNLDVADALIKIASGSATFAADQGLQLGDYAELKTAAAVADVGNALSSSLPLVAPSMKADSFYGNLVGSMQLGIETKSANATISKNVTRATANITLTLPTSPVVGQEHRVKCFVADLDSPAVVVAAQAGGATIEGAASLTLESYGAAVSLVWDGSNWMVF